MTPELEERLKGGKTPFNGEVVASSTDSSMETLLKVLTLFVHLAEKTDASLLIYEDWHEHDGYISNAQSIELSRIKEMVKNRDSVLQTIQGDDEVRTAIYPQNYAWLMRWCVDLEDEAYSDFEFCSGDGEALDILDKIYMINPEYLYRTNAKMFFDKRYGG